MWLRLQGVGPGRVLGAALQPDHEAASRLEPEHGGRDAAAARAAAAPLPADGPGGEAAARAADLHRRQEALLPQGQACATSYASCIAYLRVSMDAASPERQWQKGGTYCHQGVCLALKSFCIASLHIH